MKKIKQKEIEDSRITKESNSLNCHAKSTNKYL